MKTYLLLIPIFFSFSLFAQDLAYSDYNGNDTQNQMPQFPGGNDSIKAIFDQELVKPALEEDPELNGIIHVEFVVNDEGEVENARVVQGIDKKWDKKAIQVLLSLPNWEPGKKKGKLADYYYQMPIYLGSN